VVVLALVGVLLVVLDWREARDVLSHGHWKWVPLALLITGISYLLQSCSFSLITRSFGIRLGWLDLLGIGFLSAAMISAVGGLAGHSLRLLLMVRRGLLAGDVMAPSLFHAYLESLLFFALIPSGLTYLLLTHPLSPGVAAGLGIGTGILGVAFAVTALLFFYGPARSTCLRLARGLCRWTIRRDIEPSLSRFESTLGRGLAKVRQRPLVLVLPVGLVLADRLTRVAVVWVCFQALGSDVGLAVAVTGFAVGVALGVMSMVPGGLGVQEGTMAGMYHLLGVPLEEAVLVSVLFRVVYYMAPFGVSLAFYRGMLRGERQDLAHDGAVPASPGETVG
jgi:uncharacterized protein (TIRG00374 family)